jgi:hypothetical protein
MEGRAADGLEHVCGGGLLLKGFAQLVEQARILNGDHRLISESLHQLDLLVGKWLRDDFRYKKNAEDFTLALLKNRSACDVSHKSFSGERANLIDTGATHVAQNQPVCRCRRFDRDWLWSVGGRTYQCACHALDRSGD